MNDGCFRYATLKCALSENRPAIMSLTSEQKKRYRALAHSLRPVVKIADKGLSESVVAGIDRALRDHELIKVKLAIIDHDLLRQTIRRIFQQIDAESIQEIGKKLVLFKAAKKATTRLSNLLR